MTRPVILGMNNPQGGDPMDPAGVTGRKFAIMIGSDTFSKFDRDNVLRQKLWRKDEARDVSKKVRQRLSGRVVVVLGNEVWQALGLPKANWFGKATTPDDTTWWRLPHPSGLNSMYNDQKNISKARKLMEDIANENSD
jgi:G:T/U-mismatch repair DNA glycosylase